MRILSQTSAVLTTYLMACLPLFITLFKIFPYKPCLSGHKSMNNDLIVLKCWMLASNRRFTALRLAKLKLKRGEKFGNFKWHLFCRVVLDFSSFLRYYFAARQGTGFFSG